MTEDAEQRGLQFMSEAQKKLSSSKGFLGSLFGYVQLNSCISIF